MIRKGKKRDRDKLDDDAKVKIQDDDKKRKKRDRVNLDEDAKEEFKKAEKKRLSDLRNKLDQDAKDKTRHSDKKRKTDFRENDKIRRDEIFSAVQTCSMVDPSILETDAFKLIQKEFSNAIRKGPTKICDICWKFEYRSNVMLLDYSKYEKNLFDKCYTSKSKDNKGKEWICNTCNKWLLKQKMPMQAQANNLQLCPKIEELENLCPIELMLISQIIPFMFIVAKTRGAQHGLKGQCVLVPTDLKKIQTILPRSCDENYLISLALKRRLSDKSAVNKQHVRPAAVNRALKKLTEINPFYKDVSIDNEWADVSEQSDPELWNLLTDENATSNENDDQTDSDEDIDGNDHVKEKQSKMSAVPYPTVLHNIDGPNISPSEIVNIAPGEGQIPVSFTSELDWEALAFPKDYSTGINHYNEERKHHITPSKYVHARLKCCDDRFASNPQYIFHALDWIERNAVASSIHFAERKQFQSEVSVGQLRNQDNVIRMISDDQIFATFKNIRGTPQYFHNMLLDVLAKIRHFGVYTFFLTCSAAEFHWPEIIQVVAEQYGEKLTDEEVNNMDWSTKLEYLKRNPVTVARQIDHVFKKLFGEVILSGMHPIGQILNYDERREFQSRGTEHIHVPIHVVGAPKIDENEDSEVVEFIDKYITCGLPDKNEHPEFNSLVSKVQTHHHTTTCRKKKGITYRFNAPWPPSEKTLIVRGVEDVDKTKLGESKKVLDKVLSQIVQIDDDDLSNTSEKELLELCEVSETEYYEALEVVQKKISIIYKRKVNEVNIGPYNSVILMNLKSNMNIQFVTGVYAMLTYLTSYLCKPEHTMSELMKKASKEAYGKDIRGKMQSIGNIIITKREVSTHEAVKRVLSLPLRLSNIDVMYIPTGLKKNRTRMLKSQAVLEFMDAEDTNAYALNLLDKYENRPDELEQMCLADFCTNYISTKARQATPEDIESYTEAVSGINDENHDETQCKTNIIVLKDEMGKMRKRIRPCVMRFHKVSKMKSPEEFYLRVLQLYMPWRSESELKTDMQSYEDKYKEVENDILSNIKKHEPSSDTDIDYDDLHNYDILESDEEDNDEFSMINPDLIDFDINDGNGINNGPIAPTRTDNILLPNDQFYDLCSQLNEGQQHIFNFIMKYAMECHLAENNNKPLPEPFYIFLSGSAGVGKSFLVNVITEYLKRVLRYPDQAIDDQPSVLVTASTGKAATVINGTTLHSAFRLPVQTRNKSFEYRKPSDEGLHEMRNRYKYLKVLLIDEISMVGYDTFQHLNLALQLIKNNKLPFGGVCLMPIGDFLQLPPVKQKGIFMKAKKGTYQAFHKLLWQDLFKLHELSEIVRQSSDPEFAQMLNRIREGKQTDDDVMQIKALADTDTSDWPNEFVKLYLTNHLAARENEECIANLNSEIFEMKAEDSRRDLETGTCTVSIPDSTSLNDTANLPAKLKVCVGARLMLTYKISISDRLINGSIGTVKHLDKKNKPLNSIIYLKFDDPKAGNSRKDRRLRGELKECVPISAVTKTFPFTRNNTTIIVQRKQFPAILGHSITVHKSQGSTLEYMKGDLDRTTKKHSESGKQYKVPICQGILYTLLSRAKSRDKVQLLNFESDHIKVNTPALEEMDRMRKESLFCWQHPLMKMSGNRMCLFNIRSWNLHIEHFLTDTVYTRCSSLFCFTETHVNDGQYNSIEQYVGGWKDLHKRTNHGLAICYNAQKVRIIQEFPSSNELQMLPVLIKMEDEFLLLVVVYRPPSEPIGNFIQNLIQQLNQLPTVEYRTIIVGDFNLDQRLKENEEKVSPLSTEFKFEQLVQFSTHIHGGILDLVFDNRNCSNIVPWIPSPYSDHFVLLIEL